MMTVTVVHDHRGRAVRNGEGPLEVRITVDRRTHYVQTGVKCRKSEWKLGQVVNRADSKELNERLGMVLQKVQAEVNRYVSDGNAVDVAAIRQSLWSFAQDEEGDEPLIGWIEDESKRMNVCSGTKKHYATLVTRMREFGKMRRWSDISAAAIYDFDAFLHGLKRTSTVNAVNAGTGNEPVGDAAVYNYHKCLKAMLNRAMKYGKIEGNPYLMLRGEFRRGERESIEYLTEEEMKAVESIRPLKGSQMALARDLFVFQMYTGLSYSDTQVFDIKKYEEKNGVYRAVAERVKTGVPYVSRLLPPAVDVLKRYNMHLPIINNADYNKMLKALGMAAGIEKTLHSHLARHTFATWMLSNGVKIENLARMLGHTNITQTQRYAKVLAKSVNDDFDKIAEKLSAKDNQ